MYKWGRKGDELVKWSEDEDNFIRWALSQEAKKVEEDKQLYCKIREQIYIKGREKDMSNRKTGKKGILIAAIVVALTSGTILAGSLGMVRWERKSLNVYEKFPSQEQLKEDGDFIPKFAKELPGGYTFMMASLEKGELIDKYNKANDKGNEFTLRYYSKTDKTHSPILTFHASDINHGFDYHYGESVSDVYKGTTLYFSDRTFKYVAMDYKPTAEEQKKIDNVELSLMNMEEEELAEMSSKMREKRSQSISWKEGGIYYLLMSNGEHQFKEKELVDMAKAIIDAQ